MAIGRASVRRVSPHPHSRGDPTERFITSFIGVMDAVMGYDSREREDVDERDGGKKLEK